MSQLRPMPLGGADIGGRFQHGLDRGDHLALGIGAVLGEVDEFVGGRAICLDLVSSSERTRSSINGATRINASSASRARIPRSFLSFALLRLKVTPDIFVPYPAGKVKRRVQKAFPELGKIRGNAVNLRAEARHDTTENHAANQAFTKRSCRRGAGHRARLQGSASRSCDGNIDRGVEDVRRHGDFADYRCRTARIRRKSRAGSQGEMAGVNVRLSGHRAASDRAAAIQQGERGRGAVRRHPFDRPPEHLRSVSQGNQFPKKGSRNYSSSSIPARSRRRPASRPARPTRSLRAAGRNMVFRFPA